MSIPIESIRRCAQFTLDVSDDGWSFGRANIAAAQEVLAYCDSLVNPDTPGTEVVYPAQKERLVAAAGTDMDDWEYAWTGQAGSI
jgi:hypothetical protein